MGHSRETNQSQPTPPRQRRNVEERPADRATDVRLARHPLTDITLFGELPEHNVSPFETRSARSLIQHTRAGEGADLDPFVTHDGVLLAFASTRHSPQPDVYFKRVGGMAVTQLTADPSADVQPAINPRGTHVAFASNRSGNWDIWVMQIDGQKIVHPSWSSDGERLVYCMLPPSGQWEIWIADADEGANRKFVGYGLFPEWSPIDDVVLFQRARQRGTRWFGIWTLEIIDGEPGLPTEIAASSEASLITPSFSADGQRIAFAAVTPEAGATVSPQSAGTADIWTVHSDGTSRTRLTDGRSSNFTPVWSPDGRIFFTSARSGREAIWSVMSSDGSTDIQGPMMPGNASAGVVLNVPEE